MELLAKLQEDLKTALKGGDSETVGTIRMLQAAIQNEHIAKGKEKEFTDEDVMAVLRKEAKKRRESADVFAGAGRTDLAEKEEKELALIKTYLNISLFLIISCIISWIFLISYFLYLFFLFFLKISTQKQQ